MMQRATVCVHWKMRDRNLRRLDNECRKEDINMGIDMWLLKSSFNKNSSLSCKSWHEIYFLKWKSLFIYLFEPLILKTFFVSYFLKYLTQVFYGVYAIREHVCNKLKCVIYGSWIFIWSKSKKKFWLLVI